MVVVDHSRTAGLASSGNRPSEFPEPAGLGHDPANFRVSGEIDNQRGALLLANPEACGTCEEGFCLDYRHRTFQRRHYGPMVRYPRISVKRMACSVCRKKAARFPIRSCKTRP